MRVLFINTVYGKGSTGKIVRALGNTLEKQGHEYKALYGRPPIADDSHAVYVGSAWETYIHAGLSRLTDRSGFYSKRATAKAIRFIRDYAPDVIHLHNLHGYYLNVAMLFDYLKNEYTGKVVWTLHDCWAFTGHCTHYTCAGCDRWKTACHHCPEKSQYPTSLWLDNAKKNFADKKRLFVGVPNLTIVTVSQWLKEQAEQSFLGNYPVKRVYNGIDYQRFKPLPSDVRQALGIHDEKMILSVSDGWNERKGYGRLMALANHAPTDWHFVVVGLNKEQIDALPDNCIGLERTDSQEELIKLYSAADVFYNPSLEETFGLVTAEAIACGTPAVVMNSTACAEPLSGYGRVLTTNEWHEALRAIEDVLSQGKSEPNKPFTEENMIAGYVSCYTE